jgi:hypothetical protein
MLPRIVRRHTFRSLSESKSPSVNDTEWDKWIVNQITNQAATPNQALHLTGGACSVFVTCSSLMPRQQVNLVVRWWP